MKTILLILASLQLTSCSLMPTLSLGYGDFRIGIDLKAADKKITIDTDEESGK